jgi:hypothetical protein
MGCRHAPGVGIGDLASLAASTECREDLARWITTSPSRRPPSVSFIMLEDGFKTTVAGFQSTALDVRRKVMHRHGRPAEIEEFGSDRVRRVWS